MDNLQTKILEYLKKGNKKIDLWGLKKKIGVKGEEELELLQTVLHNLEEEGLIYLDSKGYYDIFDAQKLGKIQGKLTINRRGNGYVEIKDKNDKKIRYVIPRKQLNGALPGDIVVLTDFQEGDFFDIIAKVEKVVKRKRNTIIFEYHGNGVFFPYNLKTQIAFCPSPEECKKYVEGDLVSALVDNDNLGKMHDTPMFGGQIKKYIGHKDDPNIDIEVIANEYGFYLNFSDQALAETQKMPTEVLKEEMEEREDLRDEVIFTIDGEDTKDIDDAIGIKKDGDYYIVTVSIADVAHYVKPGMALFEEAMERGTSVYLIDSVLPMLPHKLSNGICSLNEGADRLTKSVRIKIDKKGKIVDYNIFKSVINSKKKMTYEAVNDFLINGKVKEGYEKFTEELKLLEELTKILEKNKIKRGYIDFCSNEVKIKTDQNGMPIVIEERTQKIAEKIIENLMVAANEVIASNYYYMSLPFVYRIHDEPNVEKIADVLDALTNLKLIDEKYIHQLLDKISKEALRSYDISNLLDQLKGTDYYKIISNMLVRCMSRAVYSSQNHGHYALALDNYTHFTSPIRRFPDLMIHTLMNSYENYENIDKYENDLPVICEHASFMERQAEAAEKAANELKLAEYMSDKIGENYEAVVCSCNSHGMNVVLDNLVRGKVDFQDILDGVYCYDKNSHQLITQNGKETYKIGDIIQVQVKDVSIPYRTVKFYASKKNISNCKPKVKRKHIING